MKLQQHIFDQEKNKTGYRIKANNQVKRSRPKSKSNLNIIQDINHGKEEVSL